MAPIPPTNPHHLAAAYSSATDAAAASHSQASRAAAVKDALRLRAATVEQQASAAKTDAASLQDAQRRERLARLVAAVVPGGIDFDEAGVPVRASRPDAIPFYRSPAQQHSAATQLHTNLGGSLDVTA